MLNLDAHGAALVALVRAVMDEAISNAHAHLDELEPEKGYAGRLRWVCQRANNSGKHSCGVCK